MLPFKKAILIRWLNFFRYDQKIAIDVIVSRDVTSIEWLFEKKLSNRRYIVKFQTTGINIYFFKTLKRFFSANLFSLILQPVFCFRKFCFKPTTITAGLRNFNSGSHGSGIKVGRWWKKCTCNTGITYLLFIPLRDIKELDTTVF